MRGQFQPGFICYGVPIGMDIYVKEMLFKKISEIEEEAEKICETLEENREALWCMLRSSTAQKLDYWLQLVYPSIMEEVGARKQGWIECVTKSWRKLSV